MNIYYEIWKNNQDNLEKVARSIMLDTGELQQITYGELFEMAERYANYLKQVGILAGDRVAIVSENCPHWDGAYLAIVKQQATAVLIDASLPKEEIIRLLDKSDVRGVFLSEKIKEKLEKLPSKDLPVFHISTGRPFEGAAVKVSNTIEPTIDGDPFIANIIYSSGTTKTASGIMHTHESMLLSTMNCIKENSLTREGRFLSIIPNSHIYGVVCLVLGPMLLGADVRYIETMSGEAVLGALNSYHPTILPAVPKVYDLFKTQIEKKINSDKKTKMMFEKAFPICLKIRKRMGINLGKKVFQSIHQGFGGSMEILCSAGAPMSIETAEFYYGCGFNLLMTYGATETNIPTIGNRGKNLTTDSTGKAYPNVEIQFTNEGEILIKSPYLMKGYLKEEEATKEAFTEDGWFKSGDLGKLDENGNVVIVGRCKENLVLATGKKVAPDDIEACYTQIPGVKEFVVCGVPVEQKAFDEAHAFIVPEDYVKEEKERKALRDKVAKRSAEQSLTMKVAEIHIVDEIPKTSLQKPKRYLLQQFAKKAQQEVEGKQLDRSTEDEVLQSEGDTMKQVLHLIAKIAEVNVEQIRPESKLFVEFAMDSLNVISLAVELEEHFGFQLEDNMQKEMTVNELVARIETLSDHEKEAESVHHYPKTKNGWDYSTFNIIRHVARYVYKVHVKNEEIIPNTSGYIICANHVSNFDYLYLTINFKKERFKKFACMAKKELFKGSIISKHLAKVCGMVPVDRTGANTKTMNVLKERLKKQWGVLIHPEGTRSKDGKMGELKQGAAHLAIEANVPIVPAYIKGGFEIYPRGKKMPNLFNFRRMRRYKVEVVYGEPIYPADLCATELTKLLEHSMRKLEAA